ncbi:pentatricopeptide repeat domain-containing protein [Rutstroemia sp. NJR-2017a WRK4]|nr:pentatricopeptide repeat domain-containing protein [Rutstroemia sp. NJR-2017a WRK4]
MRPALQRLINRPSSLDLLRYLVRATEPCTITLRISHRGSCARRCSSNLCLVKYEEQSGKQDESPNRHPAAPLSPPIVPTMVSSKIYGHWDDSLTFGQLEFESNLSLKSARKRLVDSPKYATDMQLWGCLLAHRQRRYGHDGVKMFWQAIYSRNIHLPTEGILAWKMWGAFLDLGFHDRRVLAELVQYSDELLRETGQRWKGLYTRILEYSLKMERSGKAILWHRKLVDRHPPDKEAFESLCKRVIDGKGNIESLRKIYDMSEFHVSYSKIILRLCAQEEYFFAYHWHRSLLRKGDAPRSIKPAEPLIRHLAKFNKRYARAALQILNEAGLSFVPVVDDNIVVVENRPALSREMMNLIHGETFNVKVKNYDDDLGARWLATSWVPLDMSIKSIHALGVRSIGPRSLQAIALREQTEKGIIRRIDQLYELGISIGQSRYAQAIESFARKGQREFLRSLLKSDQHPDSFDDFGLQEQLLASYASDQQSTNFQRTLAIRLLGSRSPEFDIYNIHLRVCIIRNDMQAMLTTLSEMQMNRIPTKTHTIIAILHKVLMPRNRGRRPPPTRRHFDDVGMAVNILTSIMKSGSAVPVEFWREIIRRLGMLGRSRDMKNLCIFLASWYGPRAQNLLPGMHYVRTRDRTQAPPRLSSSDPLHPLRILFPVSVQKSIIEWGFIYPIIRHRANNVFRGFTRERPRHQYSITDGLELLRELYYRNVAIDVPAIRRAIIDRLISLYGPGISRSKLAREARRKNPWTLDEMLYEIDRFLGREMFPGIKDVPAYIERRGNMRWEKLRRKHLAQEARRRFKERGVW